MNSLTRVSLSIIFCFNVTSCGGGGGSSQPVSSIVAEPSDPILTGYFTDNGVEGLSYTTETQSGVTDAAGTFKYKEGEEILFSIGAFEIGEKIEATSNITPVHLVSGATIPTSVHDLKRALNAFWEYRPGGKWREPSPMITLHNMITFMHALDSDKDSSNGISISDGMGLLFENITIDFTVNPYSFREDILVRTLLREAVGKGLITSSFVKYPGQAMDDFYLEHGFDHRLTSIASETKVSENPNEVSSIVSYSFDERGNLTGVSQDFQSDGAVERIGTYTFDHAGNEVSYELLDSNGALLERTINTFDDSGNRIKQREESSSGVRLFNYTYEKETGNWTNYSKDSNADGSPEAEGEAVYDASGNLLTKVFDGRTVSATYDIEGNMLEERIDRNSDGLIDHVTSYTYNGYGYTLTSAYDGDYDGMNDVIATYTYDSDGHWTSQSWDSDGDGVDEFSRVYTFDGEGNKVEESYDSDNDGSAEAITTYTYDSNGNLLEENNDRTNAANSRTTYKYGDNGDMLSKSVYQYSGAEWYTTEYTYTHVETSFRTYLSQQADAPDTGLYTDPKF
ncbi:hypothetical protein N9D72_01365 [Porticoccaceae bacterium]|nr:hypothetical protein [Porticoccaceae bacterium]